mmetsp:Transcript_19046/g.44196  ORF Transcript_19046/g.44196 Transcript_19046/m.44196 type:complete len:355 (+) Transcript_19046:656-1720(+)
MGFFQQVLHHEILLLDLGGVAVVKVARQSAGIRRFLEADHLFLQGQGRVPEGLGLLLEHPVLGSQRVVRLVELRDRFLVHPGSVGNHGFEGLDLLLRLEELLLRKIELVLELLFPDVGLVQLVRETREGLLLLLDLIVLFQLLHHLLLCDVLHDLVLLREILLAGLEFLPARIVHRLQLLLLLRRRIQFRGFGLRHGLQRLLAGLELLQTGVVLELEIRFPLLRRLRVVPSLHRGLCERELRVLQLGLGLPVPLAAPLELALGRIQHRPCHFVFVLDLLELGATGVQGFRVILLGLLELGAAGVQGFRMVLLGRVHGGRSVLEFLFELADAGLETHAVRGVFEEDRLHLHVAHF